MLVKSLKAALFASAFTLAPLPYAAAQQVYPTPEAAFDAFQAAVRKDDPKALENLLGPQGKELVYSGDTVADANARKTLIAAYDTAHNIAPLGDNRAVLELGKDKWELPIPVVKDAKGWRFDLETGRAEVLNRRIGRNEISAMQASLAYVDAQREYASRDRGEGGGTYAQRLTSSPGKKDGLYWPVKAGEPQSPLGPTFAKAQSEGYAPRPAQASATARQSNPATSAPYHGYVYRIITAQGPAAKGGAANYIVNGKMIGGYALIATPTSYGASGVMTFIVNHDAKIYQKDLGPKTAEQAAAITTFNPDKTWTPAR